MRFLPQTYYQPIAALSGRAGNDAFTKVLLHMDGADASTTFTDSNYGGSAKTWTANGNAQIDTAQSKFGGASGLFDGTGDYVDAPDHADFTLGSGDFTIDCWFNRAGGDATYRALCGQVDSGVTAWASFLRLTDTNVMQGSIMISGSAKTIAGTTAFTATGWHHVALVRTSGTLKLFLDGTQEGGDLAAVGTVGDSAAKLTLGRLGEFNGQYWNGWIDEFRISVGIARWTANFTPPPQAYF
ncbi:MAG: LamG domain-containing protein [Nitrobacter sp.]|uniref:LamG domain-containing protein n=1 Tax=Nitrobacter sp. TaxID=29420 RepID=UPI00261F1BEC|nr:LamG domain-containing protein [Nitrobacter sp.]MCV0387408.1 LamG domain-containing protein [Nitrobacter sp.]